MSWFSTGHDEAEKMAASTATKRTRNFFTRDGDETARIRFLAPASESFNYKRSFVKWAKGQKLLTSPGIHPDPFVSAGLQLQAAFAWKVIDRRILEFDDKQTGEKKKIGPRVLYFADGMRTRKQLIAFEKAQLALENEDRAADGQEPLTLDQYNLTSYDIIVQKPKGSPWILTAGRKKPLSAEDKELIEKQDFDLMEELKPLPIEELRGILGQSAQVEETEKEAAAYSYSDDDDDTVDFD